MNEAAFRNLVIVHEHGLGLGFLTTCAIVYGLWSERRRPFVPLVALVWVALIILTTVVMGQYTLWYFIYRYLPGASAVRSTGRIILLMLIPASAGFAMFVDRFTGKLRWLGPVIALFCLGEQVTIPPAYDKMATRDRVAAIVARIPAKSSSFYYSTDAEQDIAVSQIDAMWASMMSGVATVNGWGATPDGYGLRDNNAPTPDQRNELKDQLANWRNKWGLASDSVAWVGESDPFPVVPVVPVAPQTFAAITPGAKVLLESPDSAAFLGSGWSSPSQYCWTDGRESEIHFSISPVVPFTLRFHGSPFLVPGKLLSQPVHISLNDTDLGTIVLRDYERRIYSVTLPGNVLKEQNVLKFAFPSADTPVHLNVNSDGRMLGMELNWFELDQDVPEP
jgi:hypothetical protein